nr:peptidoglycan recognition protein-like [Leptinotarsa decemlineata]
MHKCKKTIRFKFSIIQMSHLDCLPVAVILLICNYLVKCHNDCPVPITRQEWNAAAPLSNRTLRENPPPFVVVHHSATKSCLTEEECKSLVKSIQRFHMVDNRWDDIGYTFLIGGDGRVYEGRGWNRHGAHVVKYNARSLGICLLGDFQDVEPPHVQVEVLKKFIECAQRNNRITENYHLIGHRQGSVTLCPGDKLFDVIKTWPHFDENPM